MSHSPRFSSTLLTHSNEAELEFQSERAYRAVKSRKTGAPDTIRTCDLCRRAKVPTCAMVHLTSFDDVSSS